MTCKECKFNISAMLDGYLDSEVCRQVEAHLDSCDECRIYYESLLAMRDTLASAKDRPLPEGFENRLHFALEREAQQPAKKQFMRHMPIIAAAAASILLIAGAISFTHGFGSQSAKNAADSAPKALEFAATGEAPMPEEEAMGAVDETMESGAPEAATEGIMAVQEAPSTDMLSEAESVYVRTTYQVGVTAGDDAALVDSLNTLSVQNSGVVNSNQNSEEDASAKSNLMSIDIPAENYNSFIEGLSGQYAVDYVNINTEDLSDEIYSLQQQEIYLRTYISDLLSLQERTTDQDDQLEAFQNELPDVTTRLSELYTLCSNVQVNIIINNQD